MCLPSAFLLLRSLPPSALRPIFLSLAREAVISWPNLRLLGREGKPGVSADDTSAGRPRTPPGVWAHERGRASCATGDQPSHGATLRCFAPGSRHPCRGWARTVRVLSA